MGRLFDAVVGAGRRPPGGRTTRRRRPSNWRACPATPTCGRHVQLRRRPRARRRRVIDPAPVVAAVIADVRDRGARRRDRRPLPRAVGGPDRRLATAMVTDAPTVALSGGVFQNALLLRLTMMRSARQGIRRHHAPPRATERRRHRAGPTVGGEFGMRKGGPLMCLAVPGKNPVSIEDRDGTLMSVVDFGGIKKDVCLQYIPDARSRRIRRGACRFRDSATRRGIGDADAGRIRAPRRARTRSSATGSSSPPSRRALDATLESTPDGPGPTEIPR